MFMHASHLYVDTLLIKRCLLNIINASTTTSISFHLWRSTYLTVNAWLAIASICNHIFSLQARYIVNRKFDIVKLDTRVCE